MTGGDIPVLDGSYSATADYSSYQFSAVTLVAAGTVTLSTANQPAMGILQDKPAAAGVTCAVREAGHSKVRMYSSGTKGDALKVADSYGRLGTGTAGSDVIIGIAQESWTATDQIIAVVLISRQGQGASYRAGHLVFNIPILELRSTGTIYSAMDLGFVGTVTDMFALVNSVCSATTSATAAISLDLGASGTTAMTGLTIPVGNLTAAACNSFGSVIAGTGTAAANTFIATDKISVVVTQGSIRFGAADTGTIELHVVTN
jgi:hypothetical protein